VRPLPSNNSGRRARAALHIPIPKQTDLPISYNIAPSQKVLSIGNGKPAIWRRVQVPGSINLTRLHDVFQVVMGWTDSHLHHFVDAPIVYSVPSGDNYPGEERLDERRFRLADVARHEKASFIYEYDFGDSWVHEVVVEKTLPADPNKKYVCLHGKNACPPEDCGGIWGYYELLKAVKNPKHKETRKCSTGSAASLIRATSISKRSTLNSVA